MNIIVEFGIIFMSSTNFHVNVNVVIIVYHFVTLVLFFMQCFWSINSVPGQA